MLKGASSAAAGPLARAVDGDEWVVEYCARRGDVNDGSATRLAHVGQERLGHGEHTECVGLELSSGLLHGARLGRPHQAITECEGFRYSYGSPFGCGTRSPDYPCLILKLSRH